MSEEMLGFAVACKKYTVEKLESLSSSLLPPPSKHTQRGRDFNKGIRGSRVPGIKGVRVASIQRIHTHVPEREGTLKPVSRGIIANQSTCKVEEVCL